MFRVQRAGSGSQASWKTICTNASEEYARSVYQKQLKLNSFGRFRLLNAEDKVLEEAAAPPLFQRQEDEEESKQATYYSPTPSAPRPS